MTRVPDGLQPLRNLGRGGALGRIPVQHAADERRQTAFRQLRVDTRQKQRFGLTNRPGSRSRAVP